MIFLHNKKDFPGFGPEKSFLKGGFAWLTAPVCMLLSLCFQSPQTGNISKKAERILRDAGTIQQIVLYKVGQGNGKYGMFQVPVGKLVDLVAVSGNTESGGGFHIFAVGQLDFNPIIPIGIQNKIVQCKTLNLGSSNVLTHTFAPFIFVIKY